VRVTLQALADIVPLSLKSEGSTLSISSGVEEPALIVRADTGASPGHPSSSTRMERRAVADVPSFSSIVYHDPDRDYQSGLQRAWTGAPGLRGDERSLAAVLTAAEAKALAENRLASAWAARASARLDLSWRSCLLRPGRHVRCEGLPGLWKIGGWTFEKMALRLELIGVSPRQSPTGSASPGRPIGSDDFLPGATVLRLLELPSSEENIGTKPRLFAAAAGTSPAWRRADLTISVDGGQSWSAALPTAAPAVMGKALTSLPTGGSALIDASGSFEVELLNQSMWLENRSDDALVAGANLALVGEELLQFGKAEPIGACRFRLSRLLRGRRGTEWAAGQHLAGERFILLDRDTVSELQGGFEVGSTATVLATGISDEAEGVSESRVISGEALRPPSPVHLRAEELAGGDLLFSWVRRSRTGWSWASGPDVPLGEEAEAYKINISWSGGSRSVDVIQPSFLYSSTQQALDGANRPLAIEVAQAGTYASSRPRVIILI